MPGQLLRLLGQAGLNRLDLFPFLSQDIIPRQLGPQQHCPLAQRIRLSRFRLFCFQLGFQQLPGSFQPGKVRTLLFKELQGFQPEGGILFPFQELEIFLTCIL